MPERHDADASVPVRRPLRPDRDFDIPVEEIEKADEGVFEVIGEETLAL